MAMRSLNFPSKRKPPPGGGGGGGRRTGPQFSSFSFRRARHPWPCLILRSALVGGASCYIPQRALKYETDARLLADGSYIQRGL